MDNDNRNDKRLFIPKPLKVTKATKNVKSLITKEHLSLFYFSIGAGFTLSSVLNMATSIGALGSAAGFCTSVALYLVFAKVNNSYHRIDKERLNDLAIATKYETIDYLVAFNQDVNNCLKAIEPFETLTEFFNKIFKEEARNKTDLIMKVGDVIRFVGLLKADDRERIYRHYIVESSLSETTIQRT
jgi:hypothetical protein